MAYEMIVLDLDGTLTNSNKEITPTTKKALIDIQKRGKKVVLASGRPTPGVTLLADELDFGQYGNYVLAYNGGRIINCATNEIIYNQLFPREFIPAIYDMVKTYDVDIVTYSDDEIISGLHTNASTRLESHTSQLPIKHVENFAKYVNFPVNKVLLTGEVEVLEHLLPLLRKEFSEHLSIYLSGDTFLDIMPKGIEKANSLKKLLQHLNLTTEQMICCGDGFNDLSMIQLAGLGVAMENAEPAVKEAADFVTKSNDEDGVLYVIEKFMRD